MLRSSKASLLPALTAWLVADRSVSAAVLFGSQVRASGDPSKADDWSDVDLHVITNAAAAIENTDWSKLIPDQHFCLQVVRPATGGVRKVTVLFDEGEADLVILPAKRLYLASIAMSLGLQEKIAPLRDALNSLSTIMGGGYRFLKGERKWGPFYAKVVTEMAGFRIDDAELENMAEVFLCDLLWILQKLNRGELVSAQRMLHRSLIETNVLFLHEARIRESKPTFQQARRVEQFVDPQHLATVCASARLNRKELAEAAWRAYSGLEVLMRDLVPKWSVPVSMGRLLARYSVQNEDKP